MDENIHHIYNRGADKRRIFMDEQDCKRFLECLRDLNNKKNVSLRDLHDKAQYKGSTSGNSPRLNLCESPKDERLVEVLCYCLMPNHFHLILRSLVENGIAIFMRKVGTGYTMYFNKRYQRSGHLFQGRYKHKEINSEEGFIYLSGYIHLNPVMAGIVRNPLSYQYSSYASFIGKGEDDFLTFSKDIFDIKIEEYKKFILELKSDKELLKRINNIIK